MIDMNDPKIQSLMEGVRTYLDVEDSPTARALNGDNQAIAEVVEAYCKLSGEERPESIADINLLQSAIQQVTQARGMASDDTGDTHAFEGGNDMATETAEKGKKRRRNNRTPEYAQSKVIAEQAEELQASNYGLCAQVVSTRGAIVAYLVPTPDHLDISKSTKPDKATGKVVTTFAVKNAPPGPVKGYVVAVPMQAIEEVDKYAANENASPDVCNVERASAEGQPYGIRFLTPEDFTETFLSAQAAGSIREAPELWAPCVNRRYMPASKTYDTTSYMTLEEVEANAKENDLVVAGKNAVVLQISYRKVGGVATPYTKAKHTLRPKLQAPGNFIPARIYETDTIRDQYSQEEAERLNKLYFARFQRSKTRDKQPLLSTLAENDTSITVSINPDSLEREIVATRFFSTQPAESIMNEPINHWYNRNADGSFETFAPVGHELIRKTEYTSKNGSSISAKISYKEIQAEQDATGTAYVPDFTSAEFQKIGAACDALRVKIDPNDLVAFFKRVNVLRDKTVAKRGGTKKRTAKPMGLSAFGFSQTARSEALRAALANLETGK